MTTEDAYILRVQGEEELKKLQAAVDAAREALAKSIATNGPAAASTQALAGQYASLQNQYNATSATVEKLGAATGQAGKSGAMGLMMLSQTIDDAQYGFKSIVNNIPMLATAMGQTMGMSTENAMKFGGALGILAVAINLNLKHLEEWKSLGVDILEGIGLDKGKLESVTDSLWNLADALNFIVGKATGGKIQFSVEEMKRQEQQEAKQAKEAKEGKSGFEQAEKDVDKETKDRAQAFQKAVEGTSGGGKAIRDELFGRLKAAGGYTEKQLDEQVKTQSGEYRPRRELLQEEAGRIYGRAKAGDLGSILQIGEMEGAGFQARLNEAMPEGKELEKKREDESKKRKDEAEKEAKEKEREADRRKKEDDADYQQAIKMIAAEEEQKTKGFATNLQGRYGRARVAGEGISEAGIAEELERTQGLSPEDAARYATGVKTQLEKGFDESLRKGAGERGTTTADELARLKANDSREQMATRLGIADAGMGVLAAQANLREKFLGGAPERYNIADFASQAEAKGGDVMKDQLEVLRAIQEMEKANITYQQRIAAATEKGQAARFG